MDELEADPPELRGGGATASALSTSTSTLACGRTLSARHSRVPKQASPACQSGHTPKCFAPSSCSLCRYSSPSLPVSGTPSASTYSLRLASRSALMTAKVEMNCTFMARHATRPRRLWLEEFGRRAAVIHTGLHRVESAEEDRLRSDGIRRNGSRSTIWIL